MENVKGWYPKSGRGFGSFVRMVLDEEVATEAGAVALQNHQLVVRKFLVGSPYRGLLLFHGLGSGKTCAAVSAVEALITTGRRVFVVLPASLQSNFEREIKKCANDERASRADLRFIRMNGVRTTDKDGGKGINVKNMTFDGASVHGSVIVVDEVHNLAGYKRNGGTRGEAIYKLIYKARDAKIICLSGTVIVNSPFELGIILNMISGVDYSIRFPNPSKKPGAVKKLLKENTGVSNFYAEGTAIVVRPVPEGYRRVSPESRLLVRASVDLVAKPHEALRLGIQEAIGAPMSIMSRAAVFPKSEQDFEERFVDEKTGKIKNPIEFQRASVGFVSYFKLSAADAKAQGFPDVLPERRVVLNMTATMFERYKEHRSHEISMEQSSIRRSSKKDSSSQGNFRSGSRMLCNFAFKTKGARPFSTNLTRTRDDDEGESYNESLLAALASLTFESLRGDQLREQSPKMAAILRAIDQGPGPVLVYSNFRTMEGVGIFSRVLEAAGYSRLVVENGAVTTDPRKKIFHEFQGAAENPRALEAFNGANAAWNRKRSAAGARAAVDVILITGAGSEGISLRGVRQVHIMEPHWHEIRIHQVVGRAARLGSHSHLPAPDRTVEVFRYVMRFAAGKQREDQQLRRDDGNLTTDEYIHAMSVRKAVQAETFLSPLKAIAIDCGMYPESSKCLADYISF